MVARICGTVMATGVANRFDNALPRSTAFADGAQTTPGMSFWICRPGWLICIQMLAPFSFAASAQARKGCSGDRASRTIAPGPVSASACTITLPVMSSPVPPAPQRRYSSTVRPSGACSAPAMPSSIAALAMRLGSTAPERSVSGEKRSGMARPSEDLM